MVLYTPVGILLATNHNPPTTTPTTASEHRKQEKQCKANNKNERSVQTKAHTLGLLSSPTPSVGLFACQSISGIYHAGGTLSTICHFLFLLLFARFFLSFGVDVVRR